MNDLLKKISKAADAFAGVIMDDVQSDNYVKLYRYQDFRGLFFHKKKEYKQVEKCTISIQEAKEFDDMIFAQNKYIIRILMLDCEKRPICVKGCKDEYVGGLIIADGIDKQLQEFMGGKSEKTVGIGGK